MKIIIKAIKTLWATLKDPHLLSSRPHHKGEFYLLENWYCPECETWQSKERTWENEEFVNESDGDDIPNYKCNKCILGE